MFTSLHHGITNTYDYIHEYLILPLIKLTFQKQSKELWKMRREESKHVYTTLFVY